MYAPFLTYDMRANMADRLVAPGLLDVIKQCTTVHNRTRIKFQSNHMPRVANCIYLVTV